MAFPRIRFNRALRKVVSYFAWAVFKFILRNIVKMWTSIDLTAGDFVEFGRKAYNTPQVHRMRTPGRIKGTLSSIKRNNKRSTDADFEGRSRRELFQSSPVKFLLENDRFCKLPKKKANHFESNTFRQRRMRL